MPYRQTKANYSCEVGKHLYRRLYYLFLDVEAPTVSPIGGITLITIFISSFLIFLTMTRRLKIKTAKALTSPRYYLSDIASYITGDEKNFPIRALFFMIDSLAELGIIKREAVIRAKLYAYLISMLPIPKNYKRAALSRIVMLPSGELTNG